MKNAITLTVLVAAAFVACGGEEETTPEPQPQVMNSPAAVLYNVEYSWNHRDIGVFKRCLSSDFAFYFNPNDVGQIVDGYQIPVSWNYAEMTTAVGNMLEQAYSIALEIPTENVGTPGPTDDIWRADNISPNLLLYTTPDSGFIVNAGYCNFEFKKYRAEDGKDYWRLTKWWDFTTAPSTMGRLGVAPTSLGRVLALYR
jgi:hypothetical protein